MERSVRRVVIGVLGAALGLTGCHPASLPPVPLAPVARPAPPPPLPDGAPVFVPQRTGLDLSSAIWQEDGRTVAMLYAERRVVAADLDTGFVRGAWDVPARMLVAPAAGTPVIAFAFAPGLFHVVVPGKEGWAERRSPVKDSFGHFQIQTARAGGVAVAWGNADVAVFDTATFTARPTWSLPGGLRPAAVAPDGSAMAAHGPRTVAVVEGDGRPRWSLALGNGAEDEPKQTDWSDDGATLAVRTASGVRVIAARSGEIRARGNPCAPARPWKMSLSPRGTHLLAACTSTADPPQSAAVVLVDDQLNTIGELPPVSGAGGDWYKPLLDLRFTRDGRRAGVIDRAGALTLLEIGSSQPRSGRSPGSGQRSFSWSPDLERVLASQITNGVVYQTLHDVTGAEVRRLGLGRAEVPSAGDGSAPPNPVLVESPLPRFVLKQRRENGEIHVEDTQRGVAVALEPPAFGPLTGHNVVWQGDVAIAFEGAEEQGRPSSRMFVWDLNTGKLRSKTVVGRAASRSVFSVPERGLVAVLVWWGAHDAWPCTSTEQDPCHGVTVVDLAYGKRLFTVPVPRFQSGSLEFSADGSLLLAGGEVLDAATGKRVFPASGAAAGEAEAGGAAKVEYMKWLGRLPRLLVTRPDRVKIVDPAAGVVRFEVTGAPTVVDTSPEGTAVLLRTGDGTALFDTATGALRPLPPHPASLEVRGFVRDARFVRYESTGSMGPRATSVLRVTDGRWLSWEGALVVTDEGVFDGPPASWNEGAFRMGPDVLRHRMVPLAELASRFHRPGLQEAFFRGEPVSPAP